MLQAGVLFCLAEPLVGRLHSACCEEVSAQRLWSCGILFVSSVSCKRNVLSVLTAFPKNALLPSVSQGRGQFLLLCSIKSVRCTREGVAGKDCGSDKWLSQLRCFGSCLLWSAW